MVRCNLNRRTYEKHFPLLLQWKSRAGLDFLMERIISSLRNLNFCIWPKIENHTSNSNWWKMRKGRGYKTKDVMKIDIIDIQLRCKPNQIVILSFLSCQNACLYFVLELFKKFKKMLKYWRWYVGRNYEKSALKLQTFKDAQNWAKKWPNLFPKAFLCLTGLIYSAKTFLPLLLLTQKKKALKVRLADIKWFPPLVSLVDIEWCRYFSVTGSDLLYSH